MKRSGVIFSREREPSPTWRSSAIKIKKTARSDVTKRDRVRTLAVELATLAKPVNYETVP